MAEKHPKRPRDFNQFAKHMVDLATMDDDQRRALQAEEKAETSPENAKAGKHSKPIKARKAEGP